MMIIEYWEGNKIKRVPVTKVVRTLRGVLILEYPDQDEIRIPQDEFIKIEEVN